MNLWASATALVGALVGGLLILGGLGFVAPAVHRSKPSAVLWAAGLIVAGIAVAGFTLNQYFWQVGWAFAYLFVCIIGGGVGAAELVSRYKDRPEHAIATWPAGFYVLLNAVGSIAALYLMSVFAEKLGWPKDLESGTLAAL